MKQIGKGFLAGASAAMRGLRVAASSSKVRRTYVQLVLVLMALAIALDAAGIWTVWHFTDPTASSWWAAIGWWLLRLAGIAIVLLAAPVISLFIVNAAFPILSERVFLSGLETIDPARAQELRERDGLPILTGAAGSLIRLLLFILISLVCFAVSFIPVAGAVLGPALSVYFTARALGWEMLDPYFDKLELRFDAQHDYVRKHRPAIVGFGLPFSFIMAVPLVGPLVFGLAQAAAGVLVAEVLEAPGTPPR